jgi:hypothetical protein
VSALTMLGSTSALTALAIAAAEEGLAEGWVALHECADCCHEFLRVGVRSGKFFEFRQRNFGFLAEGAFQTNGNFASYGGGVAEEPLVDVANLLNIDVAERNSTSLTLDLCNLH